MQIVYEGTVLYNKELMDKYGRFIYYNKLKKFNFIVYCITMLVLGGVIFSSNKEFDLINISFLIIVATTMAIYLKFRGHKSFVKNLMKKDKHLAKGYEVNFIFTEDEFIYESYKLRLNIKYNGIYEIEEDDKYIYLKTRKNINEYAIIEKSSLEDIDEFRAFIKNKIIR